MIVFFEGTSAETLVENTIFDTVSLPSDKEKTLESFIFNEEGVDERIYSFSKVVVSFFIFILIF